MSEQTPDTETGMADGQDPSMEDILASIRKIIAEDDVQTSPAPDSTIAEAVPDVPNLGGDVSELVEPETLDLDIISDEPPAIDQDIDALIGDMDVTASDKAGLTIPPITNSASESLEDILDLEIPMDETETASEIAVLDTTAEIDLVETETLVLEDELIDLVADPEPDAVDPIAQDTPKTDLVSGALAAMGLGGAAALSKTDNVEPEVTANEGDELSLMLDNMLEDTESYRDGPSDMVEENVIDPAADLLAEDVSGDDILAELDFIEDTPEDSSEVISKSDPDIDLVKSLMADLTEEPLHDEAELVETEADSRVPETHDEGEATSNDILDEILSITLDDETKLSEEVVIPEIETPIVEASSNEVPATESLSLKDIAAAAEADADASDSGVSSAVVAGLGAAAAGSAAVVAGQKAEPELEDAPDDVDSALSQLDDLLTDDEADAENLETELNIPEPLTEETTQMARAKKTDAIIDEVTETATAGAFASLNQVVEEKATVAERGDRIGDLVMEALQPMLKEWLDANLKGIVERAVTKEVKRISSGK